MNLIDLGGVALLSDEFTLFDVTGDTFLDGGQLLADQLLYGAGNLNITTLDAWDVSGVEVWFDFASSTVYLTGLAAGAPIPEPGTWAMLAGLTLVGFWRVRRSRLHA